MHIKKVCTAFSHFLFLINPVRYECCDAHFVIFPHGFLIVNRPTGEGYSGVSELLDLLLIIDPLMSVEADADRRVVKTLFKSILVELRDECIEFYLAIALSDLV